MNLFMIAYSNIRKNKSMTFTLIVLIVFAAILLYIGTSVMLSMNTFLDDKNKEYNGSSFTVFAPHHYEDTVRQIVNRLGGYEQIEVENAVSGDATVRNMSMNEKSQSVGCLFLNADQKEQISFLKILDKGEKKVPNSIILPYYLKIAKGYKTGDDVAITYDGKTHNFVVYGFSEDIMFAIPSNLPYYKCYVYEDEFQKLYDEKDKSQFFLLKTLVPKGTDTDQISNNFIKELNHTIKDSKSYIYAMDYDGMKIGVSIFFIIIMVFLIVFSFIIILIALTVIRFAVVTFIEGNIKNIGSMEALGYTGKELVRCTVLQFLLITLFGTLIGLIIAILSTGIITNIVSSSIGLIWISSINVTAVIINIAILLGSVLTISYLASAKINKITPIAALRSGIDTHNFRKNYFPLVKGKLNVNIRIGFKILMYHMKQNITIFVIVTLMSFVCVFAFTTQFNLIINNTAMLRLIGLEKSNLMVNYAGKDSVQVFDDIAHMDQVKKTVQLTGLNMTLYKGEKEATPSVNICNNYNEVEINTIVKGRYPTHDNEIAVTSLILKQLGAKMGDVVMVQGSSAKKDYMIVGITQHIYSLGKGACLTEEGMKRISPEFTPSDLYVDLKDSKDREKVTNIIQKKYSGRQLSVVNMDEKFDTILETFNQAITAVCYGCIIITLLIIALILYLLIRIRLLKERMRIGISKALGYTTKQLILQVTCSFVPVCMIGALLGTLLATYFINPVLATLLSVGGSIENCHFVINPILTLVTFLAISLFSTLITALVARSVRKITPIELFVS